MTGKKGAERKIYPDQMCIICGYWYSPVSIEDSGACSHCERARRKKTTRDRTDFVFIRALNFWEKLNSEYRGEISEDELIYFFRGRVTRKVKIGYTSVSPLNRLLDCQVGSPDQLEVLGVVHAPFVFERELHDLFAPYHSHGEWFDGNPILYKFIKRISYMPDLSKFKK